MMQRAADAEEELIQRFEAEQAAIAQVDFK